MRVKYKGLVRERHGKGVRYRVRPKGNHRKRITIPVGPGEPGFERAYDLARRGIDPSDTFAPSPAPAAVQNGSLGWLVARHLEDLEIEARAGRASHLTVKNKRSHFRLLLDMEDDAGNRFADLDYAYLGRAWVRDVVRALRATPHRAQRVVISIRVLFDWAIERGLADDNPATGIRVKTPRSRVWQAWTPEDVQAYLNTHPRGSPALTAFLLAHTFGLRRSDVYRIGMKDFTGDPPRLRFQPQKRGSAFVDVACPAWLWDYLRETVTPFQRAIVLNDQGRPFASAAAYGNKTRRWREAAGVPHLAFHGLRTRFIEERLKAGIPTQFVAAAVGHRKASTTEGYARGIERARMADRAMDGPQSSPPSGLGDRNGKKKP